MKRLLAAGIVLSIITSPAAVEMEFDFDAIGSMFGSFVDQNMTTGDEIEVAVTLERESSRIRALLSAQFRTDPRNGKQDRFDCQACRSLWSREPCFAALARYAPFRSRHAVAPQASYSDRRL